MSTGVTFFCAAAFGLNVAIVATQWSEVWWLHAGLGGFMLYVRIGER